RLPLVEDLEGLAVVPAAAADVAGDVDVREEVHLDLDDAVPLARLAPAPADVEGKAPGQVAARPRLGDEREELADRGEEADVGRGVGPGRPADRRLVDVDDLVDRVDAGDLRVRPGEVVGAVELARERLVEDSVDEGGLPGPGDAGHARQLREREGHGDAL